MVPEHLIQTQWESTGLFSSVSFGSLQSTDFQPTQLKPALKLDHTSHLVAQGIWECSLGNRALHSAGKKGYTGILVLQMKKQKHRKVKSFDQGPPTSLRIGCTWPLLYNITPMKLLAAFSHSQVWIASQGFLALTSWPACAAALSALLAVNTQPGERSGLAAGWSVGGLQRLLLSGFNKEVSKGWMWNGKTFDRWATSADMTRGTAVITLNLAF